MLTVAPSSRRLTYYARSGRAGHDRYLEQKASLGLLVSPLACSQVHSVASPANGLVRRRRQVSKFPADRQYPVAWHHGNMSASGKRDLPPSASGT